MLRAMTTESISTETSADGSPAAALGPVGTAVEAKLRSALEPAFLEVVNESHMHSVPKGSETHFKVVVVSARFEGLSPVRRHQLVYGTLAVEMSEAAGKVGKGRIHALAITSRTPAEWLASPEANTSPKCLGGNGK
jgi:BolA protein